MHEDTEVVLVSNRGPMSFVDRGNGFDIKRGAGGLAGALDPVAARLGDRAVWIAAATSGTDRAALAAGAGDELKERLGYDVYLLDFEPDVYSDYYDGVSNRMLWFANHCLFDELGIEGFGDDELQAWRGPYSFVNSRFSDAVCEIAEPDALVLFQDYHLTLAPRRLREARPRQPILHFTHSSFCGPRGLARLPQEIYRELIEGMLGADLVGFHVAPWSRGFLDACEELGYEVDRAAGKVRVAERTAWVRAYPIPIEAGSLRKRARGEKAERWARRFSSEAEGPIIVRADRTEPSKNIVRGFDAFGVLLDRRADLAGRARFIACLYPSRQSMAEYQQYALQIEEVVARVNTRHPGAIELFMQDDFDRTLGALRVYDCLLVNSIMDGMNLVSKEGPTINERDGAVVLSSTAGSFDELGDHAVQIEDPLDIEATASALEAALEMPNEERHKRAAALRERAEGRNAEDWIGEQIEDLVSIVNSGEPVSDSPA